MATGVNGLIMVAAPQNVVQEVPNYEFVLAAILRRQMEVGCAWAQHKGLNFAPAFISVPLVSIYSYLNYTCSFIPLFFNSDGRWSQWGSWSFCSKTCGVDGRRTRERQCNNPEPERGGSTCPGAAVENHPCNFLPFCPCGTESRSLPNVVWD